MWSLGCLLAECYLGEPLFMGKTKKEILNKVRNMSFFSQYIFSSFLCENPFYNTDTWEDVKALLIIGQNSLMFELLPVHGSFSRPTITLNILAYSNTSSLLTHLTTFNTIPLMVTYILFLFLFISFF